LECAESLADYAPTATRLHRATEIFEDVRLFKTLTQKTADSFVEYHPLLVFETDTQKVYYYVRATGEGEAGSGEGGEEGKEREGATRLL
jgi:hypothetical protein